MWKYNAATSFLTDLPVFSYAIYLWEQSNIVEPPYIMEEGGRIIHQFYYENIRLWEEEPEKLLRPGLAGMLPLLPLMKGAKQARNEIVDEMVGGLRTAGKDDILALAYAFAGLVYGTESDKHWLKRRFAMFHDILESSWSYQEIVQKGVDRGLEIGRKQGLQKGLEKGLEEGIEKGLEEGELKTLRAVLLRFAEKHFSELLPQARQIAQLNNLTVLNTAVDKLLGVQTVAQALQVLEEVKISDHSQEK